jgi:hypothetical protein
VGTAVAHGKEVPVNVKDADTPPSDADDAPLTGRKVCDPADNESLHGAAP